jgi:hypothetical protein
MGVFSRCSQGYSDDRRISWNLHHNVSTYRKYGDQLHFEKVAYTLGAPIIILAAFRNAGHSMINTFDLNRY